MIEVHERHGRIVLSHRGRPLVDVGEYVCRTIRVADVRSRLAAGTNEVEIAPAGRLHVGDAIELRNEFRFGRANYPKRHAAVVTGAAGSTLTFDPPIADGTFDDARASIVRSIDREQRVRPELVERTADRLRLRARGPIVDVDLEIRVAADGDRATFGLERRWKVAALVDREHLCLRLLRPVRRVHRRNRRVDAGAFQSRYWLDDQGFAVDAGADRDLLLMHPRELAAVELRHRVPMVLEAVTPFRSDPHAVGAMRDPDVSTYASAAARRGTVRFAAIAPEPVELAGARFTWHGAATRPEWVRITAEAEGRRRPWPLGRPRSVAESIPADASTCSLAFARPMRTRRLDVECRPGETGNLTVRWFDVLRGGTDHEALAVLDDARLHRHYHIPGDVPTSVGIGGILAEARHWTARDAGDRATARWSMQLLPRAQVDAMPRPMHVPAGAEAAFIWTEHADNATLASHRAVCFGRSDVTEPAEARGGFVGHGVPVTKSIFYANPNRRPTVGADEPQVALRDCPEFAELCSRLRSLGFDIALHSPQPDNCARTINEEAIAVLAERLGAEVWIDHSCSMVRAGISALGLVPDQPHHVGDLLARHGYRWCWTFASEDGAELFLAGLSVLQTRLGDWTVTPMTWRHPQQTGELVIWPTSAGADLGIVNDRELDELVEDRGVAILHAYPAYHYPPGRESPYFRPDERGVLRTTPEFEEVLGRIAARRDAGRLLPTTIAAWGRYVEALRHVRVEPRPDGGWTVRNDGPETVRELSLAVRGGAPRLDVPHRLRPAGEDTLVILDLTPGDAIAVGPPAHPSVPRHGRSRSAPHAAPAAGRS